MHESAGAIYLNSASIATDLHSHGRIVPWIPSQSAKLLMSVDECWMQGSCRSRLHIRCAAEVKTSGAKQAEAGSNGKAEKEPEYYEVNSLLFTCCFTVDSPVPISPDAETFIFINVHV